MLLPPEEFDRSTAPRSRMFQWLHHWARLHPIPAILVLAVASNLFGSVFSILYNGLLIVNERVPVGQRWVFWQLGLNTYNPIIYVVCTSLGWYVLSPLRRIHSRMLAGEAVPPQNPGRRQRRRT